MTFDFSFYFPSSFLYQSNHFSISHLVDTDGVIATENHLSAEQNNYSLLRFQLSEPDHMVFCIRSTRSSVCYFGTTNGEQIGIMTFHDYKPRPWVLRFIVHNRYRTPVQRNKSKLTSRKIQLQGHAVVTFSVF